MQETQNSTPVLTPDQQEQQKILADNFKTGQRWAIIGVAGNLFLTVFKYVAGILGHSTAMVADATHSASDIIASGVVFASMKIAEKPRDERHPYGHGGAEIVSTMICAVVLFIAGLGILSTGCQTIYGHFVHGEAIEAPGVIAFIAAVVSIATKEWMFRATYKVGKRINSPSLIANAWDHRSDVFSSIGTVIGIGGALLGFPVLDPVGGVVVSFFIMHMALDIAKDGLNQIMSASCDAEVLKKIEETSSAVEGVKAVQNIRAKQQGPYIMIDMIVMVDPALTITQGHDVAAAVKRALLASVEHTYDVVIHIEPYME